LDKYVEVRDYLLREFKLTAEQYRERFRTAVKSLTETYTLLAVVSKIFSCTTCKIDKLKRLSRS